MAIGGLGGLGGIEFPDILTALGTALLSSPRDAPFANLPQTLGTATQASQQKQSNAAMMLALKQAGLDDATAATLALNPTAASLAISQQNLQRQLQQSRDYFGRSRGGLGGLGGMPAAPTGAPPVAPGPNLSAAPGENDFTRLVSRAEGTDPNATPQASGFNTTLGYGKFTGGPVDLTGMTVNQVLELQQKMLQHPDNNLNSSAAGAFQVVGKTLRSLRDAGVVKGEEPYNADTQTKIANHLAMARGPDIAGLREEWRGLANVPESQIMAAYRSSYGQGANQAAGTPPEMAVPVGPGTGQPVRMAAGAGAKIPVAVPAVTPPYTAPPAAASSGNRTRDWAQQNVDYRLSQLMAAEAIGNKGLVEAIKAELPQFTKWLEPLEIQRSLEAAGIGADTAQGRAIQQQNVTRPEREFQSKQDQQQWERAHQEARLRQERDLALTPPEQKLGMALQGPYGGATARGIQAETAQRGATAEATSAAEARTKFSTTTTGSAEAGMAIKGALDRATDHLENVVKLGGYGPMQASTVGRAIDARLPDWGIFAPQRKAEIERQKFDNAMATVAAAVVGIRNKLQGGGPASNLDQVLLRADLATLTSADPSVAREANRQLKTEIDRAMELDKRYGLFQGEQQSAGAPAAPAGTTRGGVRWSIEPR